MFLLGACTCVEEGEWDSFRFCSVAPGCQLPVTSSAHVITQSAYANVLRAPGIGDRAVINSLPQAFMYPMAASEVGSEVTYTKNSRRFFTATCFGQGLAASRIFYYLYLKIW